MGAASASTHRRAPRASARGPGRSRANVLTRTSERTRAGARRTSASATQPPSESPTTCARSIVSASSSRSTATAMRGIEGSPRSGADNRGPKLPYTPGSDAAGVVEAVGPGVSSVKAGDRVYIGGSLSGAYAEMSLCTELQVHPLAGTVSFAQGAAVNVPYATAYHALIHRGHGAEGETVLVHGASGGVGIGAVQIARARGMTVIGTAGTPRGRQLVLEQGAHHALDHATPNYLKELTDLTGGRGPDLILETLANVNLKDDLDVIAMRR